MSNITKSPVMAMVSGESFAAKVSEILDKNSVAIFQAHAKGQIMKNPKLSQCSRESVYQCLMDCATTGVMPDGRNAYLIPYGTKCTLIIGYQGLINCILSTGRVKKIHADVIHEKDTVKVEMGEIIEHSYNWNGERGDITGVWARAILSDDTALCVAMSKAEVEEIRNGSQGKNSSPWTKHWSEMAKKTAIRRLAKLLPLSDVQQRIFDADDKQFEKSTPEIIMPEVIETTAEEAE